MTETKVYRHKTKTFRDQEIPVIQNKLYKSRLRSSPNSCKGKRLVKEAELEGERKIKYRLAWPAIPIIYRQTVWSLSITV